MIEAPRTTSDRNEDAASYRPVALLAIASFAVSAFFCALIVLLTLVGLISRKPFLEPWLIPLAFAGVALAVAARWQISLSEGTREGRRIANLAWWLGLIGGCLYAAYYFGNVSAIQRQARKFAHEAYVAKIADGKLDDAFAATVPPAMRRGMVGSRDLVGRFGDAVRGFRAQRAVRVLERGAGRSTVEDIGAVAWRQTSQGLEVEPHFRIRTPEGEFEMGVTAVGVEDRETGAREWFVNGKQTFFGVVSQSPYGEFVAGLESEAESFLMEWLMFKRHPIWFTELYLDTRPLSREERAQIARDYHLRAWLGSVLTTIGARPGATAIAVAMALHPATPTTYFPTFKNLPNELVRFEEGRLNVDAAARQQMMPHMLSSAVIQPLVPNQGAAEAGVKLELNATEVSASVPVNVTLPYLNQPCRGRVYATCADPTILADLGRLQEPGAQGGLATLKSTPHAWRITEVRIVLTRESALAPVNASGSQ